VLWIGQVWGENTGGYDSRQAILPLTAFKGISVVPDIDKLIKDKI
jgi:hypothetical protein